MSWISTTNEEFMGVKNAIENRWVEDKPFSYLWSVAFALNYILPYTFGMTANTGTGIILLLSLAFFILIMRYIIVGAAMYFISKRVQNHLKLSKQIRARIILFGKRNNFSDVSNCMMFKSHYELHYFEDKVSPIAYALLSVIPFAPTAIIYNIMKHFYIHHVKETSFVMGVRASLDLKPETTGFAFKISGKDLVVWALLSIISAEIFLVFWVIAAARDFKKHLKFHDMFEHDLLNALGTTQTSAQYQLEQ